ncbi:hypothetical protein TIFTF001_018493 [Ficus carica]|uniref:DUF2828 domain-containing protein n=1 Tax=Ficus carica TaxID=3494 RepID=A0AA88AB70_FICCA|nr:hypothetical protein TIFTF001_018493 [Ficus carica]
MAPPSLLGPPELRRNPRPTQQPPATATNSDPFMDLLVTHFNSSTLRPASPRLGPPPVDRSQADFPSPRCARHRQVGQGRLLHGDVLALQKHPRTLASSVGSFAEFGCFKDLPEILYRLLEGPDVRENQRSEWRQRKGVKCKRKSDPLHFFRREENTKKRSGMGRRVKKAKKSAVPREFRISNAAERAKEEEEKTRATREEKKIAMAKKVIERYGRNLNFQFFYEKITDRFAECLRADIESLKSKEYRKISLASKWCPSLDSSFDRTTLLCESVAKKLFPRESYPEYNGVEEAHYAFRVRDRLRKEVLVPLRKALELPEVFIGANQWDQLPFNRVASVAMKFYKEKFLNHDGERFKKYLEDVQAGKAKIAAGALLPHEIIRSLDDEDCGMVGELQWKRMVDDLLKSGKLSNCLAVSDVSGSMRGEPLEVSVALGLLVSELNEEPWKGKIVTFSRKPKLHVIKGDDLREKYEFVKNMDWGENTDFQKVFDLILQVAVRGNLKEEQMIKRVFVFSDMEFDQASANNWETDYDAITRKFSEKGCGKAVPEIVFWNLRDSRSTPAPGTQKGVALVSGFSKNLMKMFLDNDGEINPEAIMEAAISGKEHQRLLVVDYSCNGLPLWISSFMVYLKPRKQMMSFHC